MIDELASAIVGNAIARLLAKWFPPRESSEFSSMSPQELKRRNGRHYVGILLAAAIGFFWPFFVPILRFFVPIR